MTRILMMEGNPKSSRDMADALGVKYASAVYCDAVKADFPNIHIDIVYAADTGVRLPDQESLLGYDGLIVGGSGLHAYDTAFEVKNQIELLTQFATLGKPILGSCWGLQIAVIAAGGTVGLSSNGREIGFSRKITKTSAGKSHPFLQNKPNVFDAPCIHYDEVTKLPPSATLLCTNYHSKVQGAIVKIENSEVWAVQYHPEFDIKQLSQLLMLYRKSMKEQAFFDSDDEYENYQLKLQSLAINPERKSLQWQLGIDSDITNNKIRRAEIINWINEKILV